MLVATQHFGTTIPSAGIGLAHSWPQLMKFAQPQLKRPPRDPNSLLPLIMIRSLSVNREF